MTDLKELSNSFLKQREFRRGIFKDIQLHKSIEAAEKLFKKFDLLQNPLLPYQKAAVKFMLQGRIRFLANPENFRSEADVLCSIPENVEDTNIIVICDPKNQADWIDVKNNYELKYPTLVAFSKKDYRLPKYGEILVTTWAKIPDPEDSKKKNYTLILDGAEKLKSTKTLRSKKIKALVKVSAKTLLTCQNNFLDNPKQVYGALHTLDMLKLFDCKTEKQFKNIFYIDDDEGLRPHPYLKEIFYNFMLVRDEKMILKDRALIYSERELIPLDNKRKRNISRDLKKIVKKGVNDSYIKNCLADGEFSKLKEINNLFSEYKYEYLIGSIVLSDCDVEEEYEEKSTAIVVLCSCDSVLEKLSNMKNCQVLKDDTHNTDRERILRNFETGHRHILAVTDEVFSGLYLKSDIYESLFVIRVGRSCHQEVNKYNIRKLEDMSSRRRMEWTHPITLTDLVINDPREKTFLNNLD